VGGIFFDHLGREGGDMEQYYRFVTAVGHAFLPAYLPIVERRSGLAYGHAQRRHQLQRRGRYVEFNLLYDRGTLFGLETQGRVESILMSLPPLCRWDYDVTHPQGSAERKLLDHLKPRDWLTVA
jgi:coproporphyrinogen III oxidase